MKTLYNELLAKILLAIILVIILSFIPIVFWIKTNTNFPRAHHILVENGYRYIKFTGYKWFACSGRSDWSHTGFTAISSVHRKVSGTVCCGLIFKNCTIRFD